MRARTFASRPLLVLCALGALFAGGAALRADPAAVERRAALREAEEALRDRRWTEAAAALAAVRQRFPGSAEAIEAWVLEARARLEAGQAREALEATSAFLAAHGQEAWAGRVRHVAAEAYAKLGDAAKASETLHLLAEAATAPQARALVAARHLALADEDFDGVDAKDDLGRTVKKRDVPRALAAYRQALEVGLAPDLALKARERVALALEQTADAPGALAAWTQLLAQHDRPGSQAPPAAVERWLVGKGRSALQVGQLGPAREVLTQARERFPRGARALETLRLLAEERLQAAQGLDDEVAFEEGVLWLQKAVAEHREDPASLEAQRRLAAAYEQRGRSEKAAQEWSAIVERAPNDPGAPEARERAGHALLAAGRFDDAIAEWNRFIAAYPNHPLWPRVREQVAQAAFAKAEGLLARDDVLGAVAAFKQFAEQRPDDPRAPEALERAAAALLASKDVEGALTLYRAIAGRYATTPRAPAARLAIARALEDPLGRLEEAVTAYEEILRLHPGAPEAGPARQRLERLKGKHLELRMDRVQGTSEPATLRVVTRNIEALKVRVYRLGLEEYFRRKGTLEGVEALQLEVVKPDLTSEWRLEGYKPFVLTEADRPLPITEAGAYVIVAGDDDLTATVLTLRSDVECIVKRGHGDLLVWAFEREGQAPVAGARVLAAASEGVREVGATQADGVWHGEQPAGFGGRLLVLTPKGAASTQIGSGPNVASGFSSRAHVVTDRPVYRPGQEVAWRATYLTASGNRYAVAAGADARVVVADPRGQEVHTAKVEAGPLGTFEGRFAVDGEAPLGVWSLRLVVGSAADQGQVTFEVQEYRKPEFTVSVSPARAVVRGGERVEAQVRLAYAFGGPVPGALVEWHAVRQPRTFRMADPNDLSWYLRSPDGAADRERARAEQGAQRVAQGKGTTGDDGVLKVELTLDGADDDAELVIVAQAEDVTRRWVTGSGRVAVSRRDHLTSVRAERAVAQPKEPLTVEVRTQDVLGTPVARSGTLVLQRVRRRPAPSVTPPLPPGPRRDRPAPPAEKGGLRPLVEEEVDVASYPLTTDAAGRAEMRVACPEPGRWRLRWRATDARGTVVTAAADVEAVGEAQDLAKEARLVAAKTLHVEGDEAELLLSTPVGRGRALLTYEVARVLEHEFVELAGTSTLLRVPVRADDAPNVTVAVALPGKDGLLTASCEVVVLRRLDVALAFAKDLAAPGEEVELTVTTRDARGGPVAAEVGVSVLDAALYEIARDASLPILPFFFGDRRGHGVATTSSLGWRTDGTTRTTNPDLLADDAARSGAAGEEMARSALRLAREALRKGDMESAVAQALKAQEADPGSWDARVLLGELRAKPEAEKALRKLEAGAGGADVARRLADGVPLAAMREPADPNPAPMPADKGPAEEAFEGPQSNSLIGTGGGAGGAFKGRGGSKLIAHGGGGGGRSAVESREGFELAFAPKLDAELIGYSDTYAALFQGAAVDEPALRREFRDSAHWAPRVVTGADGTAKVKVRLPDNLTTWRAVGQGVSATALVGEGRASLTVRKELLVRVDAPRFLVQGDRATVPTAVHNGADHAQDVRVSVKVEGLDAPGEDVTVKVGAFDSEVVDRGSSAPAFGPARIEVAAVGSTGGDRTEARVPVLPKGVRHVDGRSGLVSTSEGDTDETFVEVPADVVPGSTRLVLMLQPSVDAAVLDALLALEVFPYGCVEQTVHRYLPAVESLAALRAAGSPAAAQLTRLDALVRAGAARLRSLQNDDGSFAWFRGAGGLAMTSYAVLGLVGAREAGVEGLQVPIDRAVKALAKLLPQGSEDVRALAHYAMARAGVLQPDAYAVTFRRRGDDLSVPGLAWLALAARVVGREFDATELTRMLLERRVEEGRLTSWKGRSGDCFLGSDREATGLAVRALIEAKVAGPHAERGLAWLLARRPQGGGGSTKDLAAFVGAAAAFVREARVQGFGGNVDVLLDGTRVHALATGAAAPAAKDLRVLLPGGEALAPGRHAVTFRLAGEGRLAWSLRLECVRASEDLPAEEHGLQVARRYLVPEKALLAGESPAAQPGHEILRPAARPKWEPRTLSEVHSGEPVLVRLVLEAPRDLDYVLVEDPLPAGFEVVADSTRGPYDWQERRDARQVFFVTRVPKGTLTLEYVLQATHLGAFTALGTTALALYAPEVHGRAVGQRLSVVARTDGGPASEVQPTPDELFARAQALLAKEDRAGARAILDALRREQPLTDEALERVESLLLGIAIHGGDAPEIVRSREELVRRNPGRLPQGLDDQRAMAAAYRTVGQHEAAAALYRDLVARRLAMEGAWTQTLAGRGREVEGLDALELALRAQPTSNAAASAAFGAAQRWRELRRPEGRGDRPAGKPMDAETIDALWSLTAHFAAHAVADPAGYALVESLRRTRDLSAADRAGEAFLRRFPKSVFADDTRYFLAETRFRAFEEAPSAETAGAVRTTATPLTERGSFLQPGGSSREFSEFRSRAFHLLARVAHVLGELDKAESLYAAAQDVEDAREALAWLRAASLVLDETVVHVGPGAVELPLRYRNVKKVELRAYPVDLQVLFAVRKTLVGIHRIDLSGIAPARQWEADLPPVAGRLAGTTRLPAGVAPEVQGAWLVVAKAGDLETSSLVVKTGLTAEVQRVGEKVRVHVRDAAGQPVRGAYVTVADGQKMRARGLTDGRGVFEAPGVGATVFAVASKGDQVAFARP